MDNHHSHKNDTLDLSLQGTSIQPRTISLRPSSARSDTQLKQPGIISSHPSSARNNSQSKQPQTPTRGGSARERRTSLSTSLNLSSARQRRLSNSGQRSGLITSPPADTKKSITITPSSSIFRVLSPHQHDVDGFFTDQSQQKSFEQKLDDDEWNETRRWTDEIHHLNSSFIVQQQNHGVGPIGMSRDSLNGTITDTNLFPSNDNQRMPPSESFHTGQVISTEDDLKAENTSINIQQSYQKNDGRIEENKLQQQQHREITSPIETQQQKNNNILYNRQLPSSSSISRHRITPVSSPIPSTSNIDQKIRYVSSTTSPSSSSSTTTTTSKVTLNDVYETLRKLEEVEKFSIQTPLANDSVYIIDPTTVISSPFIDERPPETSNHIDSVVTHLDETNQNDQTIESIRSQKVIIRETSSPTTTRFTIPPQSDRRQQSKKLVQSVSIPHIQVSSSIDQQTRYGTKVTTPYKSLTIAPYRTSLREDEFKNSNKINHDRRDTRVSSRMDYEEKQQHPIINQEQLNQQYETTLHHSKDFEQDIDYHLQKQKDEYEAIIQRHLKFIDQLINDKKKLSHRCELLLSELKTIDKKYNNRMRSIEESHRNELQQLKDVHEATEKLRREHWIEEKTKKLKELTVRGLEPEIQKLINKHKNELTKMKTIHEAELLTADERAAQRYIRMTEELRDQLEREKEVAISRERELAREKYEKSLHDEEKTFNEQRRRLYTEIDEEKNRQNDLIAKQRADLDKLRRDIEENHRTVVDTTKHEYEAIRLEQERRHVNEIQELKDKLTLEKQNWEENIIKKHETILINKERELREQMKQERDKEIEKIIAQFESDTTISKEEADHSAENRVKRIRDKYEAEFHELENSEKQTRERFNQIKAQITEVQGDNERLQVLLKQKDTEMNDIKKITETLQQERDRLSEIIRQEFADRLVLTEEENRRIKGEIAELRARQQLELEKKKEEIEVLQQQQEKELETIHEKIKEAITKKDEQVRGLHVQYETAVIRVEHLESLLAQQRKLVAAVPSSGSNVLKKV
ncbi:unnamed protein product [Rotaria sordida]|uniref:Uncharacterized protein n=1 Tax=Rotaria sordida TaxID=392033 RepID=A0A813NF89_9BILA|nr:unnamed protein product [Rotaria sordida]CAF1177787.1 unnamed protein product [Rotaria sordida]